MTTGSLTNEQTRFFRDSGYYRLRHCFDTNEVAAVRNFVQTEVSLSGDQKSDGPGKLYRLYDRNPELMRRVIGKPALTGALVSLLGPNVVFVKNRHNHATSNQRLGVPAEGMHRDILQPSRGLVTAVVYLQDASVENGATRVIPGSHNFPYVGVPQADGGGTWLADHPEFAGLEDQAVPVPTKAGDVLLFNGTLFHGVGYNLTGEPRISVTLGYRSVDELDANPDSNRLVVVAGDHIYRGNDRY